MARKRSHAVPVCRQHGPMVLRPVESMTPEQQYCGTWYDCPVCHASALIPSAELQRDWESRLFASILAVMEPGRWYLPHEIRRLAGIPRGYHRGILTRMCQAGLLIRGNGITTRGFCRPA